MTGTDGAAIAGMMKQLRRLCNEIASLLEAADAIMDEHGWKLKTNQCCSFGGIPARSNAWFPDDVFRFYETAADQRYLLFVAVMLANRDEPDSLDKPLVTAGLLDAGDGKEFLDWSFEYAHMHLWREGRTDDGNIYPSTREHMEAGPKDYYERVHTLAVPLTSISDVEALQAQVIDPIVSLADVPSKSPASS